MDLTTTLLQRLDEKVGQLSTLDLHYSGRAPMAYLSPDAQKALGNRIRLMCSNVPRLAVTSLAERLRIIAFHPDEGLWNAWLRNDLDQLAPLAHREALALGRSYVLVWGDSRGLARVSVESAHQVAHITDPASREVVAAIKKWETKDTTELAIFEPDRVTRRRAQHLGAVSGFTTVEVLDNPLGEVVMTPIVNTDRLLDADGVSGMADLLPLTDALNKTLADMMVGSEYYARPRRWATGIELEEDEAGNAVNPFPETDRMMISEAVDAKFGSLAAADLASYSSAVKVLQEQISAVSGLPAHYLGIVGNQPASADAIRSAEASLTARAEARQATFGRAWERVGRHIIATETGVDPRSVNVRVQWADAATRSVGQEADAVVKLYSAGLLPATYALKRLGYSDDDVNAIRAATRTESLDRVGAETLAAVVS